MLGHLVGGDGRSAHAAALEHLDDFPSDAVIAQPLSSVFGLIGFSGLAGREAEQLAFMTGWRPITVMIGGSLLNLPSLRLR